MKRFLISLSSAALLAASLLQACGQDDAHKSPIDIAELNYNNGRFEMAQTICDSIIGGQSFGQMNVDQLCRLSLLFMRLAENHGDEESNTAMATRSLEAAIARDADSTILYLGHAPVEDQARLALITAISEGHNTPVLPDTITYDY